MSCRPGIRISVRVSMSLALGADLSPIWLSLLPSFPWRVGLVILSLRARWPDLSFIYPSGLTTAVLFALVGIHNRSLLSRSAGAERWTLPLTFVSPPFLLDR